MKCYLWRTQRREAGGESFLIFLMKEVNFFLISKYLLLVERILFHMK